jgi:hypothetical protein
MASSRKIRAGVAYYNGKKREDRLIDRIDKRAAKGVNENTDHTMRQYSITKDGSRVWTF